MRATLKTHKRLFYVATLLLFLSFSVNLFGSMTTDAFVHNYKDSEALVVNQVACKGGDFGDQLLSTSKNSLGTSAVDKTCNIHNLAPYSSQFGLQGKLYTFGYQVVSAVIPSVKLGAYIVLAELLTALCSATVLALLVVWVGERFSVTVAAIFTLFVAISPMIVGLSRNLYWSLPLLILPLVYILYFYSTAYETKKKQMFWVGLGFLIYIRLLCGYEFVTTIILMAIAATAFLVYERGLTRKIALRELVITFCVGLIAFAAALGTHIYSLATYTGSVGKALTIVKERALARTVDANDYNQLAVANLKFTLGDFYQTTNSYVDFDAHTQSTSSAWANFASILNYLFLPVFILPISMAQPFASYLQSFILFASLLYFLYRGRATWTTGQTQTRTINGLFIAIAIGLVGYLSWLILAHAHALAHAHIDSVLAYLPMALFGYMVIGLYLEHLQHKLGDFRWQKKKSTTSS